MAVVRDWEWRGQQTELKRGCTRSVQGFPPSFLIKCFPFDVILGRFCVLWILRENDVLSFKCHSSALCVKWQVWIHITAVILISFPNQISCMFIQHQPIAIVFFTNHKIFKVISMRFLSCCQLKRCSGWLVSDQSSTTGYGALRIICTFSSRR